MTGVRELRAPVAYFGGKSRLAAQLVRLLPEHRHYVEPFCGSLSVLLAKAPSTLETVNDLDGALMTFWRVLRDRGPELEAVCALTPHSRAEYEACRLDETAVAGLEDLEVARRVWVQLTQGRGGSLRATGWRYNESPRGVSSAMPRRLDGYRSRLAPVATRLAQVSLEARPALEVIDAYGRHDGVLLFVDPPYLGSVRGSTSAYRHEMKSPAEHAELLEACMAAKAAVMVCGYTSPLYERALVGWSRVELDAATAQGGAYSPRREVVWSNRPLVDQPTLDEALGGQVAR